MTNLAVREYDGNLQLLGVIVLEDGAEGLTYAEHDEFWAVSRQELLDDSAEASGLSWPAVLALYVAAQNMLTRRREGPFETSLGADELLARSVSALAEGKEPENLPTF